MAGEVQGFGDKELLALSTGDEGGGCKRQAEASAEVRGRLEKFSPVHDVLILVRSWFAEAGDPPTDLRHCRTPLRSMLSTQDTVAYITIAKVDSTSTATQTSAIS